MVFIKVPSLNCVVTTGDFLLASRGTGDGARRSVCVIREVVAPQHVKVSWWLTREELESQGIVGTPSPVSNDGFINLVKCQVKEVFELASTVTLHVCYIVDLAFVFHAVTLEKQFLNCAGMERVFLSVIVSRIIDFQWYKSINILPFQKLMQRAIRHGCGIL